MFTEEMNEVIFIIDFYTIRLLCNQAPAGHEQELEVWDVSTSASVFRTSHAVM